MAISCPSYSFSKIILINSKISLFFKFSNWLDKLITINLLRRAGDKSLSLSVLHVETKRKFLFIGIIGFSAFSERSKK